MINGHTNGQYLDDPSLYPFWERAEALGAVIYLHPTDPVPAPVLDGHKGLRRATWEWSFETGSHALRLVFGGIFDRFPRARLALGHLGETLPFLLWRFDSRAKLYGVKLAKPPSDYIKDNIVVTTSGMCSAEPLNCTIAALGHDRVMFAADYPFESAKSRPIHRRRAAARTCARHLLQQRGGCSNCPDQSAPCRPGRRVRQFGACKSIRPVCNLRQRTQIKTALNREGRRRRIEIPPCCPRGRRIPGPPRGPVRRPRQDPRLLGGTGIQLGVDLAGEEGPREASRQVLRVRAGALCRARRRWSRRSRTASWKSPISPIRRWHRDPERRARRSARHRRRVPRRRGRLLFAGVHGAGRRADQEARGPQGQGGRHQCGRQRRRRRHAGDAAQVRPRGQARLHRGRGAVPDHARDAGGEEGRHDPGRAAVLARSRAAQDRPRRCSSSATRSA